MEERALIIKWQGEQLNEKASKLKTEKGRLKALSGPAPEFNWNSPTQVLYALKEIGIEPLRYDFKERIHKESSASEVLEEYTDRGRFIPGLLRLRTAEKQASMLQSYKELENTKTHRLHGSFNITSTATGRLSSSKPNMQNQDRSPAIRSLFVPTPGKVLIIGDLAQIEVRVAAHYSQDPKLMEMFFKEEDFYGKIATEVLGTQCTPNEVKKRFPEDRAVAKVIGLSILYGTGAKRLQSAIKRGAGRDYSEQHCRAIIKDYFKNFEGLKELQKRIERAIIEKGYLTNLFGRKLYIKPEDSFMHGANYLLQSTASDFMLFTQLRLDDTKSDLIALVHDELIRECTPESVDSVITECKQAVEESGLSWRVPMKLDIKACNNWGEKG